MSSKYIECIIHYWIENIYGFQEDSDKENPEKLESYFGKSKSNDEN